MSAQHMNIRFFHCHYQPRRENLKLYDNFIMTNNIYISYPQAKAKAKAASMHYQAEAYKEFQNAAVLDLYLKAIPQVIQDWKEADDIMKYF